MMKRPTLFFSLILCLQFATNLFAQQTSSCTNADFELNNFNNWVGHTGGCCPVGMFSTGLVSGRHAIMTGSGTDPYSMGLIPFVPPGGGTYTARLGNDNTGSEAEQLTYAFTVTNNTALFIYRYAVVLEDPAHDTANQPRFSIRVFDQLGAPVSCGTYNVVSGANIPGFVNNGDYRIKPWSTVGIDLSAYVGQTMTIEFTTADCGYGAHFGYAYMDCYCSPFQIFSDFCPGMNTSTLNAPPGFASYLWNTGATTATITINNPVVGTVFSCTMTSVSGCQVTLNSVLTPANLNASFYQTTSCMNNVSFIDSSYVLVGSQINQWLWDFGDGTTSTQQFPVHGYSTPGNYTVQLIAINAGGCRDTMTHTITTEPIPTANFNFTTECPGTPVTFTDQSTFPSGTVTDWTWDFGDGSPISTQQNPSHAFTNAGPFDVSLIVEGSNGCVDTIVQQVNTLPAPVANFTFTTVCANAMVNFTDNSTGAVSNWTWDFGDGTPVSNQQNPSHNYLVTGVQTVTLIVAGSNGCADTISKQVVIQVLPTANFSATNVCVNSPTQFTDLSVLTGGSITSWAWNFGDGSTFSFLQNPTHIYASAGNFNVTLIAQASNGCFDTVVKPVTVKLSPVADFTFTTVCPHQPSAFTDISSFPSGTISSWQWNFDDGSPLTTQQNPSHIFNNPGIYNVVLVVAANNGCIDTIIKAAQTSPAPAADFVIPTGCAQSPVQFMNSTTLSSGTIIQWTWIFGDGSPAANLQNPVHTYSSYGSYFVTLVAESNNGCIDSIKKEVSINPVPAANFNFSTGCAYDPIHFISTSAIINGTIQNYTWNFGDGTMLSNVTDTLHDYNMPGTYSVTLIIESAKGCMDTMIKQVIVEPVPVASFTNTNACINGPVNFTDNSSIPNGTITSWNWDFGDGSPATSVQNPSHTYTATGYYTVTLIVNGNNGCIDSLIKYIYVNPLPVANFSFANVCINFPMFFSDSSSLVSGSITGWTWYFGDGSPSSALQNPVHNYSATGFFNVILYATGSNGCTNTVTHPVQVYPQPVANFSTSVPCKNAPTFFTDLSSVSLGNVNAWNWNFGDGGFSILQNPDHTFANSATYNVSLIATSSLGCSDTMTKQVAVNTLPVAIYTATNECFNFPNSFTDQSTISQGSIVNWIWQFGDSSQVSGSPATTHLYSVPGTYYTQLIVVSDNNCRDSISKIIDVWDQPVTDFITDTTYGCEPLSVNFKSASTSTDGTLATWTWNLGNEVYNFIPDPSTIYMAGTYTISLINTTSHGCSDTIIYPDLITSYPLPVAGFSFTPEKISYFAPTVYFRDQSHGVDYWSWHFGDTTFSIESNPIHAYLHPGHFDVVQFVMTQYGCRDSTMESLEVTPEYAYYIPNAFTPNADGKNDFFSGTGIGVKKFQMLIFNRWGNLLYETSNPKASWNGTFKNHPVPEGTYLYKVNLIDIFDESHSLQGRVNVVR